MHQSTTPSLSQTIWPRWAPRQFLSLPIVQTLLPVTFGYSLSSEAVVMRQLKRWKRLWRRSLTRSHLKTAMEPFRSCWDGTTSALQPEYLYSINKSTHMNKVWKLIVCTSYIRVQEEDAKQSQLYAEFNRFEFRVFLLVDWLLYQIWRTHSWKENNWINTFPKGY